MTRDTVTIMVMAPPGKEAAAAAAQILLEVKEAEAWKLIELAPELTCATKKAGKIRERERCREHDEH